jgi:molybdopterin-guanine dinucleotide biosynthesis protein A
MRTAADPQADKGLQLWQGQPLVASVCHFLKGQGVGRIWISTNRNQAVYAGYGQVIGDAADPPLAGPLAGILAGLRHAHAAWLFVLPVDVLCWPADLLARLQDQARPDAPAFARTPEGPHPLCLLLHRSLAPALQAYLQAGGRKVQAWLQDQGAQAVDFPLPGQLVNLNTPEDWARQRSSGQPV